MKTIALAIVLIALGLGVAAAQDVGIPDSAYFLQPTYRPDACEGKIRVTLPLYLFTDGYPSFVGTELGFACDIELDTVLLSAFYSDTALAPDFWIDADDCGAIVGVVSTRLLSYDPHAGIFAEYVFLVDPDNTFDIGLRGEGIQLYNISSLWAPTFVDVSRSFAVLNTFTIAPGDANSAGDPPFDLDDIVYLINYIFADGCPPWDLNSGDVDASCFIDIDDVVYMINSAFCGGEGPREGCVVR